MYEVLYDVYIMDNLSGELICRILKDYDSKLKPDAYLDYDLDPRRFTFVYIRKWRDKDNEKDN